MYILEKSVIVPYFVSISYTHTHIYYKLKATQIYFKKKIERKIYYNTHKNIHTEILNSIITNNINF